MAEETAAKLPHNLIVEGRKRLHVSGVSDVDSFDEKTVVVYTQQGELTVRGENLHINALNVENGELRLDGTVTALIYADEQPKNSGFFSKVFR